MKKQLTSVIVVTAVLLWCLLAPTVFAQKNISFSTAGSVRSTLVFTNVIVPDVYSFFADSGELIRVEITSSSFDPTLRVVGPDASSNFFDDDSGVGNNPRIRFFAPDAGAYIVVVSSYSGNPGGGTYTIELARGIFAKQGGDGEASVGESLISTQNEVEPKP